MLIRYWIGRFLYWLMLPAKLEDIRVCMDDEDFSRRSADADRCFMFADRMRRRQRKRATADVM